MFENNTRQPETEEEKTIKEEYKIWKKNSPFLYDIVMTHALEQPSLTVQQFPDKVLPPDKDFYLQRLALGTNTSENEPNFLMIAQVQLPTQPSDEQSSSNSNGVSNENNDEFGNNGDNYGGASGKIEIIQTINHKGEVNRSRYMPQNPNLIATKTNHDLVYVFDKTRHPSIAPDDKICRPDLTLKGHKKEGYGLSQNQNTEGYLLSGSDDCLICLWDIKAPKSGSLQPLHSFRGSNDIVEDVGQNPHSSNEFCSVGDDKMIKFWDIRQYNSSFKPCSSQLAHRSEVNCVTFNPFQSNMIVTGSTDKTLALQDIRKPSQRLHTFESHVNEVFNVSQSPFNQTIMASCGADRRIIVQDLNKIGIEQTPEDAEIGPPELLFMHGGHTDKISDFCWNFNDDQTIASVADNNIVQVQQIAENIWAEDDEGSENSDTESVVEVGKVEDVKLNSEIIQESDKHEDKKCNGENDRLSLDDKDLKQPNAKKFKSSNSANEIIDDSLLEQF